MLRRLEMEATGLSLSPLPAVSGIAGTAAGAVDNGDFLRIVRDLRRVHSHIAALACPVLERAAEKPDRDAEPPSITGVKPPFPADVPNRSALPAAAQNG
jgi:hypothetical protein